MLSKEMWMRTIKSQRDYGSNEGSCFGVSDSSRLRKPFNNPTREKSTTEFTEGEIYLSHFQNGKSLEVVYIASKDVFLTKEYKARVAYNIEGIKENVEMWKKDKTQFSDLETRTIYYIQEEFN